MYLISALHHSKLLIQNFKKVENNENSNQENLSQEDRMNQFFAEMQQKIAAEEQKRTQKLEDTLESFKDKIDDVVKEEEEEVPKEPKKSAYDTISNYFDDFKGGLDELSPAVDAAKEIASDAFEKGKTTAKKLWNQFDAYTDDLEEKMRKREEAYQEKQKSKPLFHDTGDSLFKGSEGLFDKAKKFADKFAQQEKEEIERVEGELTIIPPDPAKQKKKLPSPDEKIYGFEDLDGDGDELIDDAILE